MKNLSLFLYALPLYFLWSSPAGAQRTEINFNDHWNFQGQSVSGATIEETITLPHTWNARDAQEGIPYYRGDGRYTKSFDAQPEWRNRRVFIRFEGANIQSKVVFNGQELGAHKGGYAAFCYELTDRLRYDQPNTLEVTVNNEANLEIPPLVGDFNNYGGIYRPVQLLVTAPVCITPLDYASPGIYLKQKSVSKEQADVEVLTKLSNGSGAETTVAYRTTVLNAAGAIVQTTTDDHVLPAGESELSHHYTIANPHLWHGKKDPYLYQVRVEIVQNGQVIDTKTEPLGLRYFRIDANEGFFLNDEPIDLRGVSRHQDRQDKGSAISEADHRQDMDLMLEMGVNALRLAHYQHAEIVYDMTDSAGVLVWAELPWVGAPGGFMSPSNGYENTEAFHTNAKQQLYELIRQNFNHPSIVMWSIFNEIQNPEGAEPTEFIKELNAIVKAEDPSRLSVGASMLAPQEHPNIHDITDAIAWNRYFGWYYGLPADMGAFLDEVHAEFPDYKIGISEYGAGGSIHQHTGQLTPPNPMGSPHPEEWQSYYHEENLKIFDERPFVWGTFVWNMFDFGSHFRKEGDHYGINDKGMVTYDRKTKKDVFFFYKANWSEEPVLHITSSRYIFREKPKTQVKVYTNLDNVTLTVNDQVFPAKSPEKGIITWDGITLAKGNNGIIVQAEKDGEAYMDDCVWIVESPYAGMNLFIRIFDFLMVANRYIIGGAIASFLVWFFGIRRHQGAGLWKKAGLWTLFVLLALVTLLILAFKLLLPMLFGA
jgi:beta-galactosidase